MTRVTRCQSLLAALVIAAAMAGCVRDVSSRAADVTEARALRFLAREVPAWSKDNGCFSCHNNGDGARALYVALQRSRPVPSTALTATTAWVTQPRLWEHNQGDPGFSDQRLANLQFAASLVAATEAGLVTNQEALTIAARKVAADQSADGSWPIEPPAAPGSPATYGAALATYTAVRILRAAEDIGTSEALRRAEDWLRRAPTDNVPAAAAFLLASAHNLSGTAVNQGEQTPEKVLAWLLRAQTSDGGWGPYPDSPPEAFDTAIALLALARFRESPGVHRAIRRGRDFLRVQQQPDGGWPATTRPSGGESYAQRLSTIGWVTQALLVTPEAD